MMSENQIGSVVVEGTAGRGSAFERCPYPLGAGRDKFGFGFQIASEGSGGTQDIDAKAV